MKAVDEYYTFSGNSLGEYKDRGSKFLSYAYPTTSKEEIQYHLELLKEEHPKCGHICFAYALGIDRKEYRANDDGEPSGTAGKPIYNRILSHDLTDTLIAVVRYWGGTKLGATGLIKAYKTSAEEAILKNSIVSKYITDTFSLEFDYAIMGDLLNHLKKLNIDILNKELGATASLVIGTRKSKTEELITKLKARMLNISEDRINEKTVVEGLTIIEQ